MGQNKINKKRYIGKTTKSFRERLKRHLEDSLHNSNCYFHRAIRKYGIDSFQFRILANVENYAELNELEKQFILKYKTSDHQFGYNQTLGGDGLHPNDEIRKKMSNSQIGKKHSQKQTEKIRIANIGKIRSPEIREKLSIAKKGINNPMFGKSLSVEHRRKMSIALRNPSEETRKKLSNAGKGRIISIETRKKISNTEKGKIVSMETRQKISKAKIGHIWSAEAKLKLSKTITGRKLSEEHKRKISNSLKKYYASNK